MPSWSRIGLRASEYLLLTGTVTRETDPATWRDFAYARSARSVIDVEHLGEGGILRFYRWVGPSTTKMRRIDEKPALEIKAETDPVSTVEVVDWPQPLGAAAKMEVVITRSDCSPVVAVFKVLQCFLKP